MKALSLKAFYRSLEVLPSGGSFASPLVTRILSGYFAVLNSYLQMNRTSRRICMQRLLFSVSTCNE